MTDVSSLRHRFVNIVYDAGGDMHPTDGQGGASATPANNGTKNCTRLRIVSVTFQENLTGTLTFHHHDGSSDFSTGVTTAITYEISNASQRTFLLNIEVDSGFSATWDTNNAQIAIVTYVPIDYST